MTDRPKSGDFCWNELATPNLQATKDFYGKVFGWKFADHDMGESTYTMIKHNEKEIGGIWSIPKEQTKHIPPHWMTYILVEDAEKALEKANKHGASTVKPVTAAGEMGRFAIITDPSGAHIALWQPLNQKK
jgi:uncharacterized protein